jgi:hypothetical protein
MTDYMPRTLLIGIQLISFIPYSLAFAIPPSKITRKVGNVSVEVKQISVVVGGDPYKPSTGWSSFKNDGTSLAFVKFRIRIFRNGKMYVSDEAGPYSYRGGALPELVEVKKIGRGRDLEVRIDFRDYTGAGNHRVLSKYDYTWNPSKDKYQKKVQCYYQGESVQC